MASTPCGVSVKPEALSVAWAVRLVPLIARQPRQREDGPAVRATLKRVSSRPLLL